MVIRALSDWSDREIYDEILKGQEDNNYLQGWDFIYRHSVYYCRDKLFLRVGLLMVEWLREFLWSLRLIDWLINCFFLDRRSDLSLDWLIDWFFDCLSKTWSIDWLIDWLRPFIHWFYCITSLDWCVECCGSCRKMMSIPRKKLVVSSVRSCASSIPMLTWWRTKKWPSCSCDKVSAFIWRISTIKCDCWRTDHLTLRIFYLRR